VEGVLESGFWEAIAEPRGDFSRLRDQTPRKHDFAWWKCEQKEFEGDLAQPKQTVAVI